jgi:hypothetical protein
VTLVPVAEGQTLAVASAGPVTLRDELEIWQDAFEFAKAIAPTDFVPKALRNNPPAVMACIIKGHELGVSALHALSQIHIIEGRPCVAAELQRALIQTNGHELWTEDHTITRVTLCGQRRGGQHVQKVTWTTDDAKRANLLGKPNWRAYPRAMLLARASGELARIMFADVLAGMSYNLEELSDGVEVLELDPAAEPDTPPAPRRTRRTTKAATKRAAASPPATAPAGPPDPPPGGPPPPLPGEDGYDAPVPGETEPKTGPQRPATSRPVQPPTAVAGSAEGAQPGPDPAEPAEVVTRRAQSIAIRARAAGVDHHQVVAAVTRGRTSSARDLNAAEAGAVLKALVEINAGRAQLAGDDADGWLIVEVEPDDADEADAGEPEPVEGETKADEYQRRVRNLQAQQQEKRNGGQQALDTDTDPEENPE